jgi:hypothetical protein
MVWEKHENLSEDSVTEAQNWHLLNINLIAFPGDGGKGVGREADFSPPSSAQVQNAWFYTSTPPYVFMA